MNSLYIFTGEIKSGKTTRLQKFISENPDADGILAPVIDGNRHLARIKTGETKLLEHLSGEPNPGLTTICNYKFLNSIFKWGMDELYNAYLQKPEWLIIDEIGPLELKGQALEPMVSKILNDEKRNEINIILVIRRTLVERAL
jgi:nucleoside-triphosphatase